MSQVVLKRILKCLETCPKLFENTYMSICVSASCLEVVKDKCIEARKAEERARTQTTAVVAASACAAVAAAAAVATACTPERESERG